MEARRRCRAEREHETSKFHVELNGTCVADQKLDDTDLGCINLLAPSISNYHVDTPAALIYIYNFP